MITLIKDLIYLFNPIVKTFHTLKLDYLIQYIDQEPAYLSHASNLCTAVGGDKNKEFRGNASFFEGKGPKGWNKNILLLYFPY